MKNKKEGDKINNSDLSLDTYELIESLIACTHVGGCELCMLNDIEFNDADRVVCMSCMSYLLLLAAKRLSQFLKDKNDYNKEIIDMFNRRIDLELSEIS